MDSDVLRPRPLSPANIVSWTNVCEQLAAAVEQGPGLLALVGPDGSGKTYTLKAMYVRFNIPGAYRTAGQRQAPGIPLDLVDDANAADVEALAGDRAWHGTRVVALRTETAPVLLRLRPDACIVAVQPMGCRDVDAMLDNRCDQVGLRREDFSHGARAVLRNACDRNPRKVDRLFGRSLVEAVSQGADVVGETHVVHAAKGLYGWHPPASTQGDAVAWETPEVFPRPLAVFVTPHVKADTAISEAPPDGQTQIVPPTETACLAEPSGGRPHQGNGDAWDILRRPATPAEIARLEVADRAAAKRRTTRIAAVVSGVAGGAILAGVALATWQSGNQPETVRPEATGRLPQVIGLFRGEPQAIPPPSGDQSIHSLSKLFRAEDPVQRLELVEHTADRVLASPRSQTPLTDAVGTDGAPSGQQAAGHHQTPLDQAKVERLIRLGRTLLAIGQEEDAQAMFITAAAIGGSESKRLVSAASTTHR